MYWFNVVSSNTYKTCKIVVLGSVIFPLISSGETVNPSSLRNKVVPMDLKNSSLYNSYQTIEIIKFVICGGFSNLFAEVTS